MKKHITAAVICACLLIGSLYPKLLLEHHVKLVDDYGKEVEITETYDKELPVQLQLRFLEFLR